MFENKWNRIILTLIIILAMLGLFKNLFGQKDNSQLKEIINQNAYLVDVRTPSEFSSGSADGAVNIPLDKIENQLQKFNNKKHIVVFCRSGNRSGQAKAILEKKWISECCKWRNLAKCSESNN